VNHAKTPAPLPKVLLGDIKTLIEEGRRQAATAVNMGLTLLYWRVGQRINAEILQDLYRRHKRSGQTHLGTQKQVGRGLHAEVQRSPAGLFRTTSVHDFRHYPRKTTQEMEPCLEAGVDRKNQLGLARFVARHLRLKDPRRSDPRRSCTPGRHSREGGNPNHLVRDDYWPLNTTLYSINLHGNSPEFLRYMLEHLSPLVLLHSVKSAVPGVDRNDLHPTMIALPPVIEQQAIAAFLDCGTAQLNALTAKVETAITRLTEYRQALITSAVTGKIDVRGWA
jgi:hypothetical protein